MIKEVPLAQLREPDWSWHFDDRSVAHKLENSLRQHGQLRALLVRQVEGMFEVVEGRQVFRALQRIGKETVTVHDLGPISQAEAVTVALSLELQHEVDYLKIAKEVTKLVASQEGPELSALTPFTGERIQYYVALSANFDWSQFQEEPEGLFESEEEGYIPAMVEDVPEIVLAPTAPLQAPVKKQPAVVAVGGPSVLDFLRAATVELAPEPVGAPPSPEPAVLPVAPPPAEEPPLAPASAPGAVLAAALEARGHKLLTRDGKFFVSESSRLTDEDRAAIKEHREALIALARPWVEPQPEVTPIVQFIDAGTRNQSLADFLGTAPKLAEWVSQEPPDLDGIDTIVLNFATTGLDWKGEDKPIGVTVGTLDGEMMRFLPFGFRGGNRDEGAVKRWMQEQVRGKHIVNSRTKFDIHHAREWGVDLEAQGNTFGDVQHDAALLDDHRKRFSLDILAKDYLGGEEIGRVDESMHSEYAASDVAERELYTARLIGRLRAVFDPLIAEQELTAVRSLEDAVIPTVVEMEKNGSPIDVELLEQMHRECVSEHGRLMLEVSKEAGFAFEHSASGWAKLFEKCGLQPSDSYKESVMAQIDHELIRKAYRAAQYASLDSKTFAAYPKAMRDGVLYFDINQLRGDDGGTVSGRFSIGLVQQVPNHDNHHSVFGTGDPDDCDGSCPLFPRLLFVGAGAELLEADAAQIEFRLLVHYTQNAALLQAYRDNPHMSYHKAMQARLKTYKPDMMYSHTKNYNFAAQYGARSIKLAVMMGFITEDEGAAIRKSKSWNDPRLSLIHEIESAVKKAHPEAGELLDRASHLAKPACDDYCKQGDKLHKQYPHRGYVKTMMGRRSRFPSGYKTYIALNRVLQGSGADIMKQKLVELHRHRTETGLLMRLTNHDAVLGDPQMPETRERVSELLNAQSFPELKVPILWDVKVGKSWAGAR